MALTAQDYVVRIGAQFEDFLGGMKELGKVAAETSHLYGLAKSSLNAFGRVLTGVKPTTALKAAGWGLFAKTLVDIANNASAAYQEVFSLQTAMEATTFTNRQQSFGMIRDQFGFSEASGLRLSHLTRSMTTGRAMGLSENDAVAGARTAQMLAALYGGSPDDWIAQIAASGMSPGSFGDQFSRARSGRSLGGAFELYRSSPMGQAQITQNRFRIADERLGASLTDLLGGYNILSGGLKGVPNVLLSHAKLGMNTGLATFVDALNYDRQRDQMRAAREADAEYMEHVRAAVPMGIVAPGGVDVRGTRDIRGINRQRRVADLQRRMYEAYIGHQTTGFIRRGRERTGGVWDYQFEQTVAGLQGHGSRAMSGSDQYLVRQEILNGIQEQASFREELVQTASSLGIAESAIRQMSTAALLTATELRQSARTIGNLISGGTDAHLTATYDMAVARWSKSTGRSVFQYTRAGTIVDMRPQWLKDLDPRTRQDGEGTSSTSPTAPTPQPVTYLYNAGSATIRMIEEDEESRFAGNQLLDRLS